MIRKTFIIFYLALEISASVNLCDLNAHCSCNAELIKCEHFTSFNEISFKTSQVTETLELCPSSRILLNNELNLVNLTITRSVVLRNIKGFDYRSNPFESSINLKSAELKIIDSDFEFYETRHEKLDKQCEFSYFINVTTILTKFSKIWLNENVRYSSQLCPLVFQFATIDLLSLHFISNENRLKFKHLTQEANLNANILFLSLIHLKLDFLDSDLINPDVFKFVRTVQVFGDLKRVETKCFKSLRNLKSLIFELNNLEEFVKDNLNWTNNLRQTTFNKSTLGKPFKEIFVHLSDKNETYEFPDRDLCYLKQFPNQKYIFPVVKTKPDLNCSCSLYWLIRNWSVYQRVPSSVIMMTRSLEKCLNTSQNFFNKSIELCNFEKRFNQCSNGNRSILNLESDGKNNRQVFTTQTIAATTSIDKNKNILSFSQELLNQLITVFSFVGIMAISVFISSFAMMSQ